MSRFLPSGIFDTGMAAPVDRWTAWQDSISVMFDVGRPPGAESQPFFASVNAYHLGAMVFGDTRYSPQAFQRSRKKIAQDGLDHFLIQLYLDGGYTGETNGNHEIFMRAGDICILDLGQSLSTRTTTSRTHTLVMPRGAMEAVLPNASALHGAVLKREKVLGKLLADHFTSLRQHLPEVRQPQAMSVADAVTGMIAACFRPTADALYVAHAQIDTSLRNLIKHHIDEHLNEQSLNPDTLALAFHLSRTTLYRLFEPFGGICNYIQNRRLQRAYTTLKQTSGKPRWIYEIAFACGFRDEAHFSRSFRRAFGISPSDVRAQQNDCYSGRTAAPWSIRKEEGDYADWITCLVTRD
ncbi:helix-turn-helix domain-containing protein [Undibacterium sp. Ji50W]|uniref:helix-turn-helix domain-containing protein n=1 Tax=Undibacterium sp. Ji50W TaxID=3413041 RepID=UPI003BEFB7D1